MAKKPKKKAKKSKLVKVHFINKDGEDQSVEIVPKKVDLNLARRVLSIVDKGLVDGMGVPKPGKMCVEASVAFAAGEPHHDKPTCVDIQLALIKIQLNDSDWSSDKARAKGLRRLAVAQLGSRDKFDKDVFWTKVNKAFTAFVKQKVLEQTTSLTMKDDLQERLFEISKLSQRIEADIRGQHSAVTAVEGLDPEAHRNSSSDDAVLSVIAELYVQALIQMKIPGTKFLYLTEGKQNRKAIMAKLRRRKAKNKRPAKTKKRAVKKRRNKK